MRACLFRLLIVSACLLCAAVPEAAAQFDSAAIVGAVHDPSGAVVPDATITLTNTETMISATRTTNKDGVYEFATVRPGVYVATAEKAGFSVALVDAIQVQVGARVRVDLELIVGQVSEKVEV